MFAKCVGGHWAIGVKRMDGWMALASLLPSESWKSCSGSERRWEGDPTWPQLSGFL